MNALAQVKRIIVLTAAIAPAWALAQSCSGGAEVNAADVREAPGLSSSTAPASASARPSSDRGELYVADLHEAPGWSSTIELHPDGHFDWRLSTGQLPLSARGEWQRDGGMLRLGNPEQVGEPGIALAASARDPANTLRVRLEPASARMASALEVELEFPDNQFARVPLGEGEVRIPAGEPRPVAVRLMSETFSFRTEPIAVAPGGDNVLTLRLVPADLGQAFFGSQQTGFDGNDMTIDWRGIALPYHRAAARRAGN